MRLLCFSDLHGGHAVLLRILQQAGSVDAALIAGDITHFATPAVAEGLVEIVQRQIPLVMAVAGNCDSAEIDQRLAEIDVALFARGRVVDGCGFVGVSAMPPWFGSMYELSEEQMAAALEQGRQQIDRLACHIVLTHTPPHDTQLDLTSRGQHVGSTAVRDYVLTHQPDLVVCGHIHEARGVDRLGRTTLVNCGQASQGWYALVDIDGRVKVELRRASG